MKALLLALAVTLSFVSVSKADFILDEVVAAKNDAIRAYQRLQRLENALINPPPPPVNNPREYRATETVHYVNVGIDCRADSAKKEVRDAALRVRKSMMDQCTRDYPAHRCVAPQFSFDAGSGTAAFDCIISGTLLVN